MPPKEEVQSSYTYLHHDVKITQKVSVAVVPPIKRHAEMIERSLQPCNLGPDKGLAQNPDMGTGVREVLPQGASIPKVQAPEDQEWGPDTPPMVKKICKTLRNWDHPNRGGEG